LRLARLIKAELIGANLIRADLRLADLSEANFTYANLSSTNLREANLFQANLREANLNEADLSKANVTSTIFGNVDLRVVKGLETVEHRGPSTIGIDTIYRSKGDIPEIFLKGAGVDDSFITY